MLNTCYIPLRIMSILVCYRCKNDVIVRKRDDPEFYPDQCDWCGLVLCDSCQSKLDMHFTYCNSCDGAVCWKYDNSGNLCKCRKSIRRGNCNDCGF